MHLKKKKMVQRFLAGCFTLLLMMPMVSEAATVKVHLTAEEKTLSVASDETYEGWTFNGQIPGPVVRVRQGDEVAFTLENKGSRIHSMDFHAAQTDPGSNYKGIGPGGKLTYIWKANFPGIFAYHCGTPPMIQHVSNGMFGAVIVDPVKPMRKAREYVLVQSEVYPSSEDVESMMARKYKHVVFNGYVNKYVEKPLIAKPGELVRLYIVNIGPNNFSAIHVIGGIFESVYESGNPANAMHGVQTWTIPPAGGAIFELTFPEEGTYPIVTHSLTDALRGAIGVIKVSKDADGKLELMP